MEDCFRYVVLPGEKAPRDPDGEGTFEKAGSPENVGYDLYTRAIIGVGKDARDTLYDFLGMPESASWEEDTGLKRELLIQEGDRWGYTILPNTAISLGLGVVVAIPFGYSGYVKPRGSTIRHPNRPCGLRILNDGVPIDPGFRKEIWAELYNCGPESYILYKDVRLVQLVIEKVSVARPLRVERIEDLPTSVRGGNSNGSSGCWWLYRGPRRLDFGISRRHGTCRYWSTSQTVRLSVRFFHLTVR